MGSNAVCAVAVGSTLVLTAARFFASLENDRGGDFCQVLSEREDYKLDESIVKSAGEGLVSPKEATAFYKINSFENL